MNSWFAFTHWGQEGSALGYSVYLLVLHWSDGSIRLWRAHGDEVFISLRSRSRSLSVYISKLNSLSCVCFVYVFLFAGAVSLSCPDRSLSLHLPTSCRHATISKFFGDKTPNCAGACDYCRNPKAVRAQLEKASALSTRTEAQSKPSGPFGFQPGLYEGGRKGYGFERHGDFSDAVWNVGFNSEPVDWLWPYTSQVWWMGGRREWRWRRK